MTDIITEKQTSEAITIIKNAGDLLMKYFRQANTLKIEIKKDGTKVTDADTASNELIIDCLSRLTPEFQIYSEEIKPAPGTIYNKPVWIIDPLDGTHAFIEGRDDFSILIALQFDYEVIFGLMYFPAKKELLLAKKNNGVWFNDKVVTVSKSTELKANSVYSRGAPDLFNPFIHQPRVDSGMALSMVARGLFDCAVVKDGILHDYDFASACVAIKEAGGMVTDEQGNEYRFLDPNRKAKYFVASNGLVHREVLNLF